MSRVVIFYLSEKPGPGRHEVVTDDGCVVYVRAETAATNYGLSSAIDRAKPEPDEELMNTHRVSGAVGVGAEGRFQR